MTLTLERQGPHLRATLDDPPTRNALSAAMVEALHGLLAGIEADATLRSLTLTGANGSFCAGADLKGALPALDAPPGPDDPVRALNRAGGQLFARLDACPVPVVAVVDGPALGGGLGLVACADLVVATPAARFGLPEAGLGVPPAQIAPYLVARLGPARARRLALLGERLDAEAGLAIGLVDMTCAPGEVEVRLAGILAGIGRGAPGALRTTKHLLRSAAWPPGDGFVEEAAALFAAALRGPEGREGVAAFAARRNPAWVGG
ncbi:hypothetical protein VQ02_07995 [Methylobacterium variabile]|uniref:Enoyl-CoA hydratase n=1 Tax=Methylobacterium variabile TaxID=298794 RepID=A0A0J6T482_9HYPH|nr:enoyl-CoA hydratase-related protein [Methylobacterium variabile]KMO40398.1 hypothetical protein VQ02_07995 [Methylobacterium variabile]